MQRCIPAVLPLLGPFQGRRVWPCGRNAGLRRSLIARLPPLMYTVARGIRLILVAPDGSRCRRECRRARAAHSVRLGPAPTGPSGLRAESGGAASVPRHSGKGLVALFPAQRHPPALPLASDSMKWPLAHCIGLSVELHRRTRWHPVVRRSCVVRGAGTEKGHSAGGKATETKRSCINAEVRPGAHAEASTAPKPQAR